MSMELELIANVENQLREAKLDFKKEIVVGDARPDFLVTTEKGDEIVLEVKAWDDSTENVARAIHQAKRYKELSAVSAALVVTSLGEVLSTAAGGVVPIGGLIPALNSLIQSLASKKKTGKKRGKTDVTRTKISKSVFASMPFSAKYDDTYLVAIQPAALASSAAADRVDHTGQAGNVLIQIQRMIKKADVVIADLSESRPNVLHEVGYAEALGKKIIQICSTDASKLPFNVRNNQTYKYSIGQTTKLRRKLESELQKYIP